MAGNWTKLTVKGNIDDLDGICAVMSMLDNGLMIEDYSDFSLNGMYGELVDEALLNADKTVSIVLVKFLRKALKVLVFVVFLGFVGVDTASIGALVASAGVTIGLALQGGLSNIAGGIIILLMRPFRIDDYIKGQGEEGTVEDWAANLKNIIEKKAKGN